MRAFTIFAAALAFASGAIAGGQVPPIASLTQEQAEDIVAMYSSVLEGVNYRNMTPEETTNVVVAEAYTERSDSILSIISANSTLGVNAPNVASSREEWFSGVSRNPSPNIITHNVFVAGTSAILWYWTFPQVGISKYPVTGFNLLHIDANMQVYQADIEFNSIAWAIDIFQLQQYCAPPPSSSGNSTSTAAGNSTAPYSNSTAPAGTEAR